METGLERGDACLLLLLLLLLLSLAKKTLIESS